MNSTELAHFYIKELLMAGVKDFVLSPGSRNAPLSIALGQLAEKELINLHILLDERTAGYFALGLAKKSGLPTTLVCTSGTAVANYHPAALEALHSEVPLIFLTADRPASLRQTGANQTTLQKDIFPGVPCLDVDIPKEIKTLIGPGPLQINLQLIEPLVGEINEEWISGLSSGEYKPLTLNLAENISLTPKSVVVIGHDKGNFTVEEIANFISDNNLIAISEDPLIGDFVFPHAALFLDDPSALASLIADEVVVIGRTTLSRSINLFISKAKKSTVIDRKISKVDIKRKGDLLLTSLPKKVEFTADESYLNSWKKISSVTKAFINSEKNWSESMAIKTIIENLPMDSDLFIGSSRSIREVEAVVNYRPGIKTFANRGLAGIDGNIATTFGIAKYSNRTFAILGDLTFLHDLSSLLIQPANPTTILVIDNNGGAIFNTLEQAGTPNFERVFATPHNRDLAPIVRGFGIPVDTVDNPKDLATAISIITGNCEIILVKVPNRDEMVNYLSNRKVQLASALRIGANLA